MELGRLTIKEASQRIHANRAVESPREPIADFVVSETALSELKRQAPVGCALCLLDAWDEEDWD